MWALGLSICAIINSPLLAFGLIYQPSRDTLSSSFWWSIPPVGEGHSHKALWSHANCCLKCFLRLTIALKHRRIRDLGLLWRGSFKPPAFLALFRARYCFENP